MNFEGGKKEVWPRRQDKGVDVEDEEEKKGKELDACLPVHSALEQTLHCSLLDG